MQKMTHSLTLISGAVLAILLSGCSPREITEHIPTLVPAQEDNTVVFKKWRALDEKHQSLDCSQLVSSLTPVQEGRFSDYVLHEEETEHFQFQQCRKAIQEQADAVCNEAADSVQHDSPISFGQFEGVRKLDKTCLANIKQQVKNNVLHYHVVKKRDPFLVIEGAGDSWFNLKTLTHAQSTQATYYDEIETFTVRANFGAQKRQFAYDVEGVFPDKKEADAFLAVLTGASGPEKQHD